LLGNRPRALISGGEGEILWDPERADECDKLRGAVGALTPGGDQRIRRDLEIIDRHSRRFLASLCDPEALAEPAPYMTEGGLCYIHGEHRLIAYDIGPGRNENRLWEPSPPFERLMLGARTIHEWGHLAAESGWVVIPQNRLAERQALTERLARLFDQVLAGASGAVRRLTRDEDARLSARHGSFGQGLSAAMLRRIEDYITSTFPSARSKIRESGSSTVPGSGRCLSTGVLCPVRNLRKSSKPFPESAVAMRLMKPGLILRL
jgi:hypothetical protein